MHRSLVVAALAGTLAVLAPAGPGGPAVASAQAAETVGIRIVDAPTNRTDDPRARLYIVDHLAPGTTIERRVEVSNSTPKVQSVQLYAAAGSVADGGFQFGDGHAANDLTTWTTVQPSTLTLAAGTTALATVTVAVPANASSGERYGVVWAEVAAPPPPGGGIGVVNRVGVRIYLSVGPGGEPATDFAITALEARRDKDGNPVVAATVHNTGGRALDLSGELRLAGGPGGLSAGPFSATLGTTLGLGQTEPVLVTLDKALPNGPWEAQVVLRSSTTSREAKATITFPAQPATSAGPVATRRTGAGNALPLVLGVGVLAAIALLCLLLIRHRRRTEDLTTGAEVEPVVEARH